MTHREYYRGDSRLVPSQWEPLLQSNAVSHWLGANLESAWSALNYLKCATHKTSRQLSLNITIPAIDPDCGGYPSVSGNKGGRLGNHHDDITSWQRLYHCWPFVRWINWWSIDSTEKGPVMWSFDVVSLKKPLNKQWICQWFETPWSVCNVTIIYFWIIWFILGCALCKT